MADIEVTSTSDEGFVTKSRIGEFQLTVDATGEEGPDPNATLAADYASCYIPAFRVGAQQRGHDDLGKVEIDVSAELDEDDDLEEIAFDLKVEADVDDEDLKEIVERAHDICHVDAALRDDLRADVSAEGDAF
ncbi:OsmC family protein [Halospeciosus flavus]|uniref:OsmC family protein n=1 Tax=Halospeciosus flavus TaxID=3032283 RepID=A0ABD5Z382_9EURY|nr:OsmC family protein [Halospeciosus flavus]